METSVQRLRGGRIRVTIFLNKGTTKFTREFPYFEAYQEWKDKVWNRGQTRR